MENFAERLHHLFMDVMRFSGLLQPDSSIAGHPMSLSQAFALHELDTDTPISQGELAQRLRLEKSSVSRMAAEMERSGLLERERDPDNRRLYRLRLTERGRAMHAGMAHSAHDHFERWVEAMTGEERDALLTGLTAFARVIRQTPTTRG